MKIVYFLLVLILFLSCKNKPLKEESSTAAYKLELIATDKAFSEMSSASGMKKAYIEYIDSNGVLLRANWVLHMAFRPCDQKIRILSFMERIPVSGANKKMENGNWRSIPETRASGNLNRLILALS
jgi:hypothetical protein